MQIITTFSAVQNYVQVQNLRTAELVPSTNIFVSNQVSTYNSVNRFHLLTFTSKHYLPLIPLPFTPSSLRPRLSGVTAKGCGTFDSVLAFQRAAAPLPPRGTRHGSGDGGWRRPLSPCQAVLSRHCSIFTPARP